jgi:hypothetical protein
VRGIPDPDTPSTILITVELPSLIGMKSMIATVPLSTATVVSRINVPGRYRRFTEPVSFGANSQRPLLSSPRSFAKQLSESKRGRHSQSMEPPRLLPRAVVVRLAATATGKMGLA